ncbi:hypothetical protein Godav_025476 [Gossypium davidsonii]|uniref:Uncharacterized protein n=2 Tax=Gossypium TaxID=3633 RepID=A0A7J8TD35_GOSDV|nr:hypothetical protein [Gossypium davidsonii]MBA0672311.1 hypothetical protein [Gossypium klotzschianum]
MFYFMSRIFIRCTFSLETY